MSRFNVMPTDMRQLAAAALQQSERQDDGSDEAQRRIRYLQAVITQPYSPRQIQAPQGDFE